MARTQRTKQESNFTFSFRVVSRSEISAIKKRIRFLERKFIKTAEIHPLKALSINQNIKRLTGLLAQKMAVKALLSQLPPAIDSLIEDAVPVFGVPPAVVADLADMPLTAPAIIPMGLEAQEPEMINPEWGMATPVAQLAPAFPEPNFNDQVVAVAALPSTPQAQIISTPVNPPALRPVMYSQHGFYTPPRQITSTPTEPPPRQRAPRTVPAFA